MLSCKALSVIVSTNQSCFTGRLLHVLLVSFSPLPDLSLLSPGGSACSVFAFLSVHLYLCLSVSISLPLCLSPPPLPHKHIFLDHQGRCCSFECSTHVCLEPQHQSGPRGISLRAQGIPTAHTDLSSLDFTSNSIGFANIRWANYSL